MEAMNQDVLFYESPEGGHGPGATHGEEAEMWALSYTYFAKELGLENVAQSGAKARKDYAPLPFPRTNLSPG